MPQRRHLRVPPPAIEALLTECGRDFDAYTLDHPLAAYTSGGPFVEEWLAARHLTDRVDADVFTRRMIAAAKERHAFYRRLAEHRFMLEYGGWVRDLAGCSDWRVLLRASRERPS